MEEFLEEIFHIFAFAFRATYFPHNECPGLCRVRHSSGFSYWSVLQGHFIKHTTPLISEECIDRCIQN